jgi:hypothetical protein
LCWSTLGPSRGLAALIFVLVIEISLICESILQQAFLFGLFTWLATGFVLENPQTAPILVSFFAPGEQYLQFVAIFTSSMRLPSLWLGIVLSCFVALFPTILYKVIIRFFYAELHHICGEQSNMCLPRGEQQSKLGQYQD